MGEVADGDGKEGYQGEDHTGQAQQGDLIVVVFYFLEGEDEE